MRQPTGRSDSNGAKRVSASSMDAANFLFSFITACTVLFIRFVLTFIGACCVNGVFPGVHREGLETATCLPPTQSSRTCGYYQLLQMLIVPLLLPIIVGSDVLKVFFVTFFRETVELVSLTGCLPASQKLVRHMYVCNILALEETS